MAMNTKQAMERVKRMIALKREQAGHAHRYKNLPEIAKLDADVKALNLAKAGLEMLAGDRVFCVTCEGSGEVPYGSTRGGYYEPPEALYGECPICEGYGHTIGAEIIEEYGRWPTEEEAGETVASRYEDEGY